MLRAATPLTTFAVLGRTIPARTRSAHCSRPASSRSLLPRPTRFHSSTSWLPRCTESGRLQLCLPASRKAEILAKAIRRTCPRLGSAQCAALLRAREAPPQAQKDQRADWRQTAKRRVPEAEAPPLAR